MSPRPILKRAATDTTAYPTYHPHSYGHYHQSHAVHFPPSPSLTRTFTAHSPSTYDRSPIVVTPNTCALPERGCPGRTYFDEEEGAMSSPGSRGINYARDYHPRALAFASSSHRRANEGSSSSYGPMPQLIPDLSSESDESDGFSGVTTSTMSYGPSNKTVSIASTKGVSMHSHGYAPCNGYSETALSFLPHSPSSSPPSSYAYEDAHKEKPRRRRGERERRHESSRDPDRIPSSEAQTPPFALAFSSLSISPSYPASHGHGSSPPPSPSTPKKSSRKRHEQSTSFSSFSDDGCLGGF